MFSVCYIDEAGCLGVLPSAASSIQPALVITGLIVDAENIEPLTRDFIKLKLKYFPNIFANIQHDLDALMLEIKGNEVRSGLRSGDAKRKQHHLKFIDAVFDLLDQYQIKLISRIWIKGIAQPFKGRSIYTNTTQRLAYFFEKYLYAHDHHGMMIGDFREPRANSFVSHCVFTQKYKKRGNGDAFPRLMEIPTFGISDNHAGLQITDLITSAVIYPIATYIYCTGYVTDTTHVRQGDKEILNRYRRRLKRVQMEVKKNKGFEYGITVNDPFAQRTALRIFS